MTETPRSRTRSEHDATVDRVARQQGPVALVCVWSPDTEAIDRVVEGQPDAVIGRHGPYGIADAWLSSTHFSVLRHGRSLKVLNLSDRNPIEIDGQAVDRGALAPGQVLRAGGSVFLATRDRPQPNKRFGIVGASSALERIRVQVERYGPERFAVHITGPSGAGKELVAQALHSVSGRSGACVAVNMATVDRDHADAELFGASKGAYTGADRDREGLFLAADGGTLFMDELAELDERVQAKLLRVLAEGRLRPMGSPHTMVVDVRVVSATNRDLEAAVDAGDFREDLYWRLGAVSIDIPPLGARLLDVVPLLEHFLADAEFPAAAVLDGADDKWRLRLARLYARALLHDWAGNAREVQALAVKLAVNARRAIAERRGPVIPDLTQLFPQAPRPRMAADSAVSASLQDPMALAELVRKQKGNLKASAELLAAASGRSVPAVRREIYRVLGRDLIASLRAEAQG